MFNILETVEWTPPQTITVKKQIWNDQTQKFEPRVFTRWDRGDMLKQDIEFLQNSYGPASQQGMWWIDDRGTRSQRFLWISDSAATFWALKFGGNK